MMRSAPAALYRSATSRAEIGSRPRPFLSCLAYGIERRDHGDALGRRALEGIHHDELLHEPLVDRVGVRLDHERVAPAHALVVARVDLAVGEGASVGVNEVRAEFLGDVDRQLGMRPPVTITNLFWPLILISDTLPAFCFATP